MAAGDAQVNIVFTADTSQMTSAFAKLNGELSSVSSGGATSSMAAWRKETGLTEQATIGANRTMATFGGTVGKTATDFKPATAEMRAASIATGEMGAKAEAAGGSMGKMVIQAGLLYAGYRLLREAGEAVKYVVTQSMSLETAEVRFKNLAGNTDEAREAFEGLKTVAKETNTNIVELAPAANTLLEAGVPMNKLDEAMRGVADRARVAGSTVAEMSEIVLRANTRGEVSGRELAMIAKVTGDETGRLAAEYQDMSITIPQMVKDMERFQRATEQARQDADRMASRQTQDANLAASRNRAEGRPATPGGFVPDKGPEGEEGTHTKFGKSGRVIEGSIERAAREEANRQGFAKEDRAREDKDRAESRAREDAAIAAQRKNQAEITKLNERKEAERLDLAQKATLGITGPEGAGLKGQVDKVSATQAELVKKAGLEVQDAAQNAGTGLRALSGWIDGVTKSLTGFDQAAHPIKGMQASPAYVPSHKPGGPGTDWANYKPPAAGEGAPGGGDKKVDFMAEALGRIAQLLDAALGGG